MDWWSFGVVVVLYLVVLVVGILAARYHKKITRDATSQEMMLVAGRNLSGWVGVFTMTGELEINQIQCICFIRS